MVRGRLAKLFVTSQSMRCPVRARHLSLTISRECVIVPSTVYRQMLARLVGRECPEGGVKSNIP
jgi:hypothetical protein